MEIDYVNRREELKKFLPWIPSQSCMVQGIKSIIVGKGDVGRMVQEKGQNVISFLADGIMKWCISFRILHSVCS